MQWWGKGRQLEVDASDFPTLARTGLHSEIELDKTKTITGRSIAEIKAIKEYKKQKIFMKSLLCHT